MTTHVSLAPDAGRRALAARLAGDDAETARERSGLSPAGYRQAIGSELGRLARELESRRTSADQPHDSARLVRHVAGLATPESDPGLAEHVEACESCRSFVEDLRARAWTRVSELEAAAAAPAAARAATDPVLGAAAPRAAGTVPARQHTLGLAPPRVRVLASAPTAADLTMPEPPTPWWRRRAALAAGAAAALLLVGGATAFALTSGDGPHGPTAQQLAAQRAAAAKREAAARSAALAAIADRSAARQAALEEAAKQRAAAAAARKRAAEKAARKRAAAKAARKRREARERRQAAAASAPAPAAARPSTPTPAPAPAASAPAPAPAPAPAHRSSGGSHSSGPMSQSGGSWGA
jgi:hypothetical protein